VRSTRVQFQLQLISSAKICLIIAAKAVMFRLCN